MEKDKSMNNCATGFLIQLVSQERSSMLESAMMQKIGQLKAQPSLFVHLKLGLANMHGLTNIYSPNMEVSILFDFG